MAAVRLRMAWATRECYLRTPTGGRVHLVHDQLLPIPLFFYFLLYLPFLPLLSISRNSVSLYLVVVGDANAPLQSTPGYLWGASVAGRAAATTNDDLQQILGVEHRVAAPFRDWDNPATPRFTARLAGPERTDDDIRDLLAGGQPAKPTILVRKLRVLAVSVSVRARARARARARVRRH